MWWPFNLIWPDEPEKQETTPADEILEVHIPDGDDPAADLKRVFIDAAQQAATERAKLERDLLSSGKLQKYLKNTMKYMAGEYHKKDSYDFFLMGAYNLDVPEAVWNEYTSIFLKIAKEFKLQCSITGNYIRVERGPLRKVLDDLMPETPPLDLTALRDSLKQGPYR